MLSKPETWVLYFDGGCTNNGASNAVARFGWVLRDPIGDVVMTDNGIVCQGKNATNNVAEMAALERGLEWITNTLDYVPKLLIKGDSQLVINCVAGRWKCKKPHLKEYRDRIVKLLPFAADSWELRWIPREDNRHADFLSKRTFNSKMPDS